MTTRKPSLHPCGGAYVSERERAFLQVWKSIHPDLRGKEGRRHVVLDERCQVRLRPRWRCNRQQC